MNAEVVRTRMEMPASLGEFAAALGALGGILLTSLKYGRWQQEVRVGDFEKQLAQLRTDFERQITDDRRDFERQFADMKQAMTNQALTIQRQEVVLADYARHVGKLERRMAAANLEIPEFEPTPFGGVK